MLAAIAYFLAFQALGLLSVRWLLPSRRPLDRIWLGMSLGLLEEMWFPALFAFLWQFDLEAHWAALGLGLLTAGICNVMRDRRRVKSWDEAETALLRQMLLFALPLLEGSSRINITDSLESADYIAMTEDALRISGVEFEKGEMRYGTLCLEGTHQARYAGGIQAPAR